MSVHTATFPSQSERQSIARAAWQQGYEARSTGILTCPHKPHTVEEFYWKLGWCDRAVLERRAYQ